jgi:tryptophan-rich sensory protein
VVIINKYFKNIVLFIFILILWLISGFIFSINYDFYSTLKLPSFALNGTIISIIWFIIYILISLSMMLVLKKTNIFKNIDYLYVLIINYISNQSFTYFFFNLMSPFLGLCITIIIFMSSIFLYLETKKISRRSSYFLVPYLIYNSYALILMFSVYIMNF